MCLREVCVWWGVEGVKKKMFELLPKGVPYSAKKDYKINP